MASRAFKSLAVHLLVGGVAARRAQDSNEFPTSALKAAGAIIGAGSPYADPNAALPKSAALHHHVPGEMHEPWDPQALAYARHLANNPKAKKEVKLHELHAKMEKMDEPKGAGKIKYFRYWSSDPNAPPKAEPRPRELHAKMEKMDEPKGAGKIKYFRYWASDPNVPPKEPRPRELHAKMEKMDEPKGAGKIKYFRYWASDPNAAPKAEKPPRELHAEMRVNDEPKAAEDPYKAWAKKAAAAGKTNVPVARGPTSQGGDERPWSNPSWSKKG